MVDLALERPSAHLVRLAPGRNNYSLGPDGGAGGWSRLASLTFADGQLVYEDPQRHAVLQGRISHQAHAGDPYALRLDGGGTINGAPFTVVAQGGNLAGQSASAVYPFTADIHDGQLHAAIVGSSGKPFDFRKMDVQLNASGPNLADFKYLFDVPAPNTPAFSLKAHVVRDWPKVAMLDIAGQVGATDVQGQLSSDRPAGAARTIKVALRSQRFYLRDLHATLAAPPGHDQARATPGSAPAARPGGRLLSDQPFRLGAAAHDNLDLTLVAAHVPDGPLSAADVKAHLTVDGGLLSLGPLTFAAGPGRIDARFTIDTRANDPLVSVSATVRGARLAALRPSLAQTADGALDADIDLQGHGRSLAAAAARADGRVAIRLSQGRLQKSKAAAVSGDLVNAIGLAIGDKGAQTSLTCGVADLSGQNGVLAVRDMAVVTGAGWTRGRGQIDLAHERVDLTLAGAAAHPAPFEVNAPIHMTGALAHPTVLPDPISALAGLAAAFGLDPKKPAPPDCKALVSASLAFAVKQP
jgi:uncharacterized protein involved in outer membrane biogenesis